MTRTADAKVTVGIPTFNRSKWLRESIASVLAQTFSDFRLLVSDNASDDETPDVVRSFQDSRIEYVRSSTNIGAIANLNRLLTMADSEFILLLPDDDVLYPEHLQASMEALEWSASAGLAHSAFKLIDEESNAFATMSPVRVRGDLTIERGADALRRMMRQTWPSCFSSVVYRTAAIRAVGDFPAEAGTDADVRLWLRIAANWDLAYIAAPLVGFRVHGGSVTAAAIRATGLADGSEALLRVRSRALAEQRNLFLDEASLELSLRAELRSLARLQILIDDAYLGLSSREVAQGLMETVRVSPRILRSRFFWRLVAAQMGGRKARSALSAASRSVCGMLGWRRTGLSRSSESQLPGEPQK